MKRFIFFLALLLALPFGVEAKTNSYIAGSVVAAAPSGDSCTGNLLYSHHAENNDDATTSASGTQGCSASATYKSWALAGADYDSTAGNFSDGAYSLRGNGYNDQATITNTGNWANVTAKGCVSMWYKPDGSNNSTVFEFLIDANNFIKAYYDNTADTISITHMGGSSSNTKTSTATFTAGTVIKMGWDASLGDGSEVLQVKVGANAWETTSTYTLGTMSGNFAALLIGVWDGNFYGNIDQLQIYTSADCTP